MLVPENLSPYEVVSSQVFPWKLAGAFRESMTAFPLESSRSGRNARQASLTHRLQVMRPLSALENEGQSMKI